INPTKEYPDKDWYDWRVWEDRADQFLGEDLIKNAYIVDKKERSDYIDKLRQTFLAKYPEQMLEPGVNAKVVEYIFNATMKLKVTESVFKFNKRIDGRTFDQIRSISVEVGLLPFTHGSALFTRGQTQALVTVTLGGGQDEQRTESIMDSDQDGSFMLHYNFPPFSVGEVRMLRAPSRRDVGHGHLAASSFKYMLPSKENFPYTIRIVSDILESNGSSSMATTCGSTMALMHAGVQIKKMVGGIAMGLLKNKEEKIIVLSDISGFEDDYGLMDFKVAGTEQGVTAIQLDIKYKGGFSREVFKAALKQALQGRLHILGEMKKVMSVPSPTLSDLVPKVVSFTIATDKIGAVIGSGGKTIREIIETTGTTIDVDEGLVKVFGGPDSKLDLAVRWVKTLAGQIEKGSIYEGKIRRFADFGIFVELVPGLDGLVHISNVPRHLQKTFAQQLKMNDVVKVQVLEYDDVSGRISLRLLID
ncbi:MAG: polyribonucleotide nucleotidyltransferase, partial [bacterium]|nr:polyribonucleotide nucleotidyltransferase [bacterium]